MLAHRVSNFVGESKARHCLWCWFSICSVHFQLQFCYQAPFPQMSMMYQMPLGLWLIWHLQSCLVTNPGIELENGHLQDDDFLFFTEPWLEEEDLFWRNLGAENISKVRLFVGDFCGIVCRYKWWKCVCTVTKPHHLLMGGTNHSSTESFKRSVNGTIPYNSRIMVLSRCFQHVWPHTYERLWVPLSQPKCLTL